MNTILVTGANGFVGEHLCRYMLSNGYGVRAVLRQKSPHWQLCEQVAVGDIDGSTDWSSALDGMTTVVHLAARVHVMRESESDPLAAFRRVNVAGSAALARQAAEAGVKRMIYLSSVKVNGERTHGEPYRADDEPRPEDAYGISKWEAEQALMRVAEQTELELVIVRPVLVYGAGVKGNFERLMSLIRRDVPLPLGGISNRRSFLSIQNLLDFLHCCVDHPNAAGEVFLAADGEGLSTPELIRKLAHAMDCRARLYPVPLALLRLGGWLTGRSSMIARLTEDLQVDLSKNRERLGWVPVMEMDRALSEMVSMDNG
ncbi:MAG: NAD-dependent epimerase/dehydratase family protein [Candidatus Thiodiazotropha endolucinida]|nr:NAD-dependent epimerase/dehydratase family protein [Candidatus Thiodiazotropha sp. (ex Lucina pensylvanica)]MCG8023084.1 NAD-dependent epimerase/dehydratase family protein [Candidatus Thiodiazotropha endolucinida]